MQDEVKSYQVNKESTLLVFLPADVMAVFSWLQYGNENFHNFKGSVCSLLAE